MILDKAIPHKVLLAGAILSVFVLQSSKNAIAQDSTGAPVVEGTAPAAAEQAAPKEEKKPEKLKTGIVASYGKLPKSGSVNVADTTGAPGDEASPVSGSINRRGSEKCIAVLTNNSKEHSYSVSFDVIGSSSTGGESFKRSYSTSLAPGKSSEHSFSCRKELNFAVNLKSGKALK